jgi:hypothetical protein
MLPFTELMSIGGSADVNTMHICKGGELPTGGELPECFLSGESGYSGSKQQAGMVGGNR